MYLRYPFICNSLTSNYSLRLRFYIIHSLCTSTFFISLPNSTRPLNIEISAKPRPAQEVAKLTHGFQKTSVSRSYERTTS
jgi:hypothetical protein